MRGSWRYTFVTWVGKSISGIYVSREAPGNTKYNYTPWNIQFLNMSRSKNSHDHVKNKGKQ